MHRKAAALILIVFVLLAVRAFFPERWSDWTFGDAQTMLAVQNFKAVGFRKLSFLWVPQAYSPVTELFDSSALNHHAFGVNLGDRRYRMYTHYPSWYSIPYGWMGQAGIYDKTVYQIFALVLSCMGAILFFLFIRQYFSEKQSLMALAFFLFSPAFLSYSDSLATMPFDFFLRFLSVVLWCRTKPLERKRDFICVWLVYFLNGLVSIDSYFFLPAWIVLHETLINKRQIPFRGLFFLSIAAAFALTIQLLQNIDYMGLAAVRADWGRLISVMTRPSEGGGGIWNHLTALYLPIERAFEYHGARLFLFLILFCFLIGRMVWRMLLVLLVPGLMYALVFPAKAGAAYQGIQTLPFMTVVYVLSFGFLMANRALIFGRPNWRNLGHYLFSIFLFVNFYKTYGRASVQGLDFPPKARAEREIVNFFDSVDRKFPGEKIYFQVGNTFPLLEGAIAIQVDPLYEFYSHGLVLSLPDFDSVLRDLRSIFLKMRPRVTYIFILPSSIDPSNVGPVLPEGLEVVDQSEGPKGSHVITARLL